MIYSVAIAAFLLGILLTIGFRNEPKPEIERLRERLEIIKALHRAKNNLTYENERLRTYPAIHIHPCAKHLIDELEEMRYDPMPPTPKKKK